MTKLNSVIAAMTADVDPVPGVMILVLPLLGEVLTVEVVRCTCGGTLSKNKSRSEATQHVPEFNY
jgi:hypothetical protein